MDPLAIAAVIEPTTASAWAFWTNRLASPAMSHRPATAVIVIWPIVGRLWTGSRDWVQLDPAKAGPAGPGFDGLETGTAAGAHS